MGIGGKKNIKRGGITLPFVRVDKIDNWIRYIILMKHSRGTIKVQVDREIRH